MTKLTAEQQPMNLTDEDMEAANGGFPGEMLDSGGDEQFPGEMLDGGDEPANPFAKFKAPAIASIDLNSVGPKVEWKTQTIFKR